MCESRDPKSIRAKSRNQLKSNYKNAQNAAITFGPIRAILNYYRLGRSLSLNDRMPDRVYRRSEKQAAVGSYCRDPMWIQEMMIGES